MATTNPTITPAWSLIVPAGDEFLVSCRTVPPIEIAISDTATAPTVAGHVLDPSQNNGATRALVGPGYVYARLVGGQTASASAVLTAWTP